MMMVHGVHVQVDWFESFVVVGSRKVAVQAANLVRCAEQSVAR